MIDDIKIEPLNLDGLVEPLVSPRLTTPHLPALLYFLQEKGLTPGSTTSGRHNAGSRHYTGNAVDIKGSGGFSDAQVYALQQEAALRGFRIRDERVRPKGQAVWGGPHVHLEYAGMPAASVNDNLNLDGLVEPLNVDGLTESVVPPVPVNLTTSDAAWHFGMTPNESSRLSPKARDILSKAVAEDQRKRATGQTIQRPSLRYQNDMRKAAGLKPLKFNIVTDETAPYYQVAGTPFSIGERPRIAVKPRPFTFKSPSDEDVKAGIRRDVVAASRAENTHLHPEARTEINQTDIENIVNERFAQYKAEQSQATEFARLGPSMQARSPTVGERAEEYLAKLNIDTPMGLKSDVVRGMAKGLLLPVPSRQISSEEKLIDPSAEAWQKSFLGPESVGELSTAFLPYVGAGKLVSKLGVVSPALRDALTFGTIDAVRQVSQTGTISPQAIAESFLTGGAMGKIAGLNPGLGRRIVAYLAPQIAVGVAKGQAPTQIAQGAITNLGFALAGGGKHSEKPEARIDTIPEIPNIPVSTISEVRVIPRGGQVNAAKKGIVTESGQSEYQGTTPRAAVPENSVEVRGDQSQQASSGNRLGEGGQIKQETLNVEGLVEPSPSSEGGVSVAPKYKPDPSSIVEYRKYVEGQQRDADIDQTMTLLEDKESGEIYDRFTRGTATQDDIAQFRKAANDLGISKDHAEDLIASARSVRIPSIAELSNTKGRTAVEELKREASYLEQERSGLPSRLPPKEQFTDELARRFEHRRDVLYRRIMSLMDEEDSVVNEIWDKASTAAKEGAASQREARISQLADLRESLTTQVRSRTELEDFASEIARLKNEAKTEYDQTPTQPETLLTKEIAHRKYLDLIELDGEANRAVHQLDMDALGSLDWNISGLDDLGDALRDFNSAIEGREGTKNVTPLKPKLLPPAPQEAPKTATGEQEGSLPTAEREPLRGKPQVSTEAEGRTLSQAVRKNGGIRYGAVQGKATNRGELVQFTLREGRNFINNKTGKSIEEMAQTLAEDGYGWGDWAHREARQAGGREGRTRFDIDLSRFIDSLAEDAAGKRRHTSNLYQPDADPYSTPEYAEWVKTEQGKHDNEAVVSLLEGGETAAIYDRMMEGNASESDIATFRQSAEDLGISPEVAQDLIANSHQPRVVDDFEFPEASERANERALRAAAPELQKYADQAFEIRQKTANPGLASFERAAISRKVARLEAKARGEELRHAGVDPYELLDDIIIRGGELYREGKATFNEWSQKLRDEFGSEASIHLKNVWAQLTSPVPEVPRLEDSTGIKNAVVEAERELQGLPQFTKARRAHGQSFDEGVYDVQSGRIRPRELASDIVRAFYDPKFSMERFQSRRPRPLSTEESMALLYDRMRISTERKAAETELESANESGDASRAEKALDEVSRLQQASNANDEADVVAGGEQSRGLSIRREIIKDDFSRARVLSQALVLNKGKPLPAHITAALEEKVAELAKANERIAELEQQRQSANARSEVEKVIERSQREVRTQGRRRNRQALDIEAASIKDQIAAAWKRTRSGVQPSGLAGLDPEGELTKLLGMLARNRVEAGISKAADLVDAVHEMVRDVADLTKRDVQDLISGYGKTSKPSQDEISAKLSELKSIMRVSSGKADVVEKGIRPLRSGFQRPKPTQELREALRDLRDTLRQHGIEIEKSARSPEEQQKSILDAAKTTTRNRIEDLTKWIADGKRTVANKTAMIPDAELAGLRAERDKLQTVFDAIDDPEADQKTITRALGAANKSILDLESKIKSGEIAPKAKGAQPTSPELAAARAAQKTLQDILRDMRTAARKAAKPAEDPIVTEARKVLSAQKAFMTRNQKQMVEMRKELTEAQRIAKEGGQRPEKAKRTPTPLTDEMRVAKRNANQLRRDIDNVYSVIDWANKTKTQKGFAYAAAGVRAGVLSGVKTLAKIGGALGQRIPQQYVEEAIGTGFSKIVPGAEKAPRHGGGMSAKAEADYLRGLASGALEVPSILKTGESELSLERGKRYPNIPTKLGTALAIPGRVHAAEKNPLKVAEYNRSLERNLQWAERQGMDRFDPDVVEQAKGRAYKDANEVILLGDNPITRSLTNMQRGWKDESRSIFRIFVPVAKVPSNYLSQMVGDYGLGLVRGGLRALRQRNPELLEKLTPEEADKTMRLLKRGSLGLIYMALATSGGGGAVTLGGFWSKKRKGEQRKVEPGDVRIGPATISHLWLHSPPDELAQLAGTMRREIENRAARKESVVKRVATGTATSAKGVLDQVPFLSRYTRTYDSFRNGDTLLKMAGDTLAGWVEPQIVQELAKATDREEKGKPTIIPWKGDAVQRKSKSFSDSLLVGLPIGRQYVKKDRKKMMQIRQQERRGSVTPPVPGALNLNGLVEPSPRPTP